MAGISVSGLISNSFDWKSVVDQLIQIESAPIARLQTEEAGNNEKLSSFATLKTKLGELQSAAQTLKGGGLFTGRTAKSSTSGSTWTASATSNSTTGNYTFAVSKLATPAQLNGASSIANNLNATDDVSALTLASLPTATAVVGGTFTVNGKQITIETTETLQDVFTKIANASGVTAAYSSAGDRVSLSSGSEIVLGAANDTSNILSVLRLANNGTGSITSSTTLGSVALNAPLATSRLAGALGADGSGNARFDVNGEKIELNVNTDSLAVVLGKINASKAGVTATYDSANDRVVLLNKSTGRIGVGVNDVTGTVAEALGLKTGATLQAGTNAEFTVNGGGMMSSTSNTLDESVHGIAGLSVSVNTTSTQTINVAPATDTMKTAIQSFVDKFNAVQKFIEDETRISSTANGKVSTSTLSGNHEVQMWSSELRSMAFSAVSGLSGTIERLENLGIGFTSREPTLAIKDSAKLDAALTNNTADVATFFNNTTTGFASRLDSYLTTKLANKTGAVAMQVDTLNKANTSIETQIAALNRRLVQQREILTNAFLKMQTAQSQAQQQQTTLTNFIKQSSNSNN